MQNLTNQQPVLPKESPFITVDMQDFIEGGILREKQFRAALRAHDWEQYRNQTVLVKGCGEIPVPTWSYMLIAAYLVPVVGYLMFGEGCSAIPIYRKKEILPPGELPVP